MAGLKKGRGHFHMQKSEITLRIPGIGLEADGTQIHTTGEAMAGSMQTHQEQVTDTDLPCEIRKVQIRANKRKPYFALSS